MLTIAEWLDDLGLERYQDIFDAEDIDMEALPYITEPDLVSLGIALGPRKKMMAAIALLGTVEASTPGKSLPQPNEPDAERQRITVLFCDLVDTAALSEKLDGEELRSLRTAYEQTSCDVITKYDGHIAQYLGDGIMAYFGWPRAHEDDGERAVRAGLELINAVQTIGRPERLQARVGIATGPVAVGETGDGDSAVPKAAVAETPDIAARLQAMAGSDELWIGGNTRRLLGALFDLRDQGAHLLKGLTEPMAVYQVLGVAESGSCFQARTAGRRTPLVGRDEEMDLLLKRWHQAKGGEGQVVLLSGEPGIGKSRLTDELNRRLKDDLHTRLRYQSSPLHTNTPLYPVIDQVTRVGELKPTDSDDQKLDKVESFNVPTDQPNSRALIAAMMSLPIDRYPPLNLNPREQKEQTIKALADQAVALSRNLPVLLILEDAQWTDPTTLETVDMVVDSITDKRVLVVVTFRPEFPSRWQGRDHVTHLPLNRLGRRMSAALVGHLTSGKHLPESVLSQIVTKSDGLPLFVEECTKTVLEGDFLTEEEDSFTLAGSPADLAIPGTLRDSLMARLDRLGPMKEIAQIGACIGRRFPYGLLAAIAPMTEVALQDALSRLVDSGLIYAHGTPPNATYIFKHALIQDAAYESLLKSTRLRLHSQIDELLVVQPGHR